MTDEIILQNLRDFTVQIRRLKDDAIVGTGIAATLDGKIVTCAHVVKAALGVHPRQAGAAEMGVYFPQARGDERKNRRAVIAACFPQHDDDVIILQLDGPPPLGPEQIPKLGTAEPSAFNPFRSYGYRRLAKYQAGHAHGMILDAIESPPGATLHADPVQLESNQINKGMSGAGVLDVERNLVVGLVSEVWRPGADGVDQGTAWGVNARVLSLPPMGLMLQDAPEPKQAAAQPQPQYQDVARQVAHARPESQFHAAPPPLAEWVGRADLLEGLTRDYADPDRRVTGLIGFGGEGKSSLARRWVDDLANRPTGVFWWGFYDNANVDEFLATALDFISGGLIDPRRMPSSSAKAQATAAMLANGRYLFVLDGLEVLQRQEGDNYGLLTSPDLLTFLQLFAAPGHDSFCLVTSRAPLLDLMPYTSYNHRDVGPVSRADGRALLRALGVQGRDGALDGLVTAWEGHALTLSLLGTYLAWRHGGDAAFADGFDPLAAAEEDNEAPTEARRRYSHVHRVLRRYDEHLTAAERAFMTLFSAFRTPVTAEALGRVFRSTDEAENNPLRAALAGMDAAAFDGLITRLTGYRLLRHNAEAGTYTTHPLVRSHYLNQLLHSGQAAQTHDQVKAYYLELAGDTPHNPTLAQLAPLIEVVYHACRAGAYDEAYEIYDERIGQRNRHYLQHVLGAFETSLNIMLQFFPGGDAGQEPQVSQARVKGWILNTVGTCHMGLGRLGTTVPFYERGNQMAVEREEWHNASTGYQNLAHLNVSLGRLAAGAAAAGRALELARRSANKRNECEALACQGWAAHLRGETAAAATAFREAEALGREVDGSRQYLYTGRGIRHAAHLRRAGEAAYARRVTVANLEICERNRWTYYISMCRRVLGELDAAAGSQESARDHFDAALILARGISVRDVLIEALLARGRWAARSDLAGFQNLPGLRLPQAFSDLREALGYATDGGYRIYEADIRVSLGWAQRAAGDPAAARQEATRAQTMSREMGYHWGQVDAADLLAALD